MKKKFNENIPAPKYKIGDIAITVCENLKDSYQVRIISAHCSKEYYYEWIYLVERINEHGNLIKQHIAESKLEQLIDLRNDEFIKNQREFEVGLRKIKEMIDNYPEPILR